MIIAITLIPLITSLFTMNMHMATVIMFRVYGTTPSKECVSGGPTV